VAARPTADSLFDFRVGFWISLHQRLFAESGPRPPDDGFHAREATDEEAWRRALDAYRKRWPERGFLTLLMNEELVAVNRRLSNSHSRIDSASANLATLTDVPADVRTILEGAAPVYRRTRWPDDERAAQALRARLAPMLERHGVALAKAHSRAYAVPWPKTPVRVDITPYAGPTAAYTVLEPTHITIASGDRRHEGDVVLEILFHEASHGLVDRVEASLARAGAAQHKTVPPQLWHEVLFWSTGEIVRRELGSGYTPYAYKNGLYEHGDDWQVGERLLTRTWRAYLDGRTSLDATIDAIVAGLP
jgi:hypothetical protein